MSWNCVIRVEFIRHNNHSFVRSFTLLLTRSFVCCLNWHKSHNTYDVCVRRYKYMNSQNFCLFTWNVPWRYDAETTCHSSMLLPLLQQLLTIHLSMALFSPIPDVCSLLCYFYCRNESVWNVRNSTVVGVNFAKCVASYLIKWKYSLPLIRHALSNFALAWIVQFICCSYYVTDRHSGVIWLSFQTIFAHV